jgi:hypothetical protein
MAEARVERRLAAILAADVAGLQPPHGRRRTLDALKACRRELIDPKIAVHRGRIVKTTGDGALVESASTVDATRCALEIQRAMGERRRMTNVAYFMFGSDCFELVCRVMLVVAPPLVRWHRAGFRLLLAVEIALPGRATAD